MSEVTHDHELIKKAARNTDSAPDSTPEVNPLTRLQSVIGNRAMQRMLTPSGGTIQTKLTVTAANDSYEAEADTMAKHAVEHVQRAEEDELQAKRIQRVEEDELAMKRVQRVEEDELAMKRIQRAGEEDELQMKRIQRAEEDELAMKRIQREAEDEELQAKRIQRAEGSMMDSFSVGDDFEKQMSSAKSEGQSLPDDTRGKMESAFGADFSGVKVHTGGQSAALNENIGARAFTHGSDIFFKPGEYNPASTGGQELLAHELTHTVQQGAVSAKREEKKD